MSNWLQKRLTVWLGVSLCGGALLWNVGASRAQGYVDYGLSRVYDESAAKPQKLTRDEAAKGFGSFLNDTSQLDSSSANFQKVLNTISAKSKRELNFRLRPLFGEMSRQWKQLDQIVKLQSEGDKTATVILENAAVQASKPLVLIEEDGSWGVDLVETYASWNHLQGANKAEVIYLLTGVILEGLPRNESFNRSACQSNLKQIALGMTQYAQDYDEAFPPARKWIDVLQPYVKSAAIFNCPSVSKGQRYGYAYNSKLSNRYLSHLSDISRTTSVYETSVLKRNAYGVGENLAFRHQNGANYAFADGRVKWFPKSQIPSFKLKP